MGGHVRIRPLVNLALWSCDGGLHASLYCRRGDHCRPLRRGAAAAVLFPVPRLIVERPASIASVCSDRRHD
jgi:hypothetical protein